MLVWALVSRRCRETVDLYLDRAEAISDLAAALADVPEWIDELAVVPIRLDHTEVCQN